MFNSWKRLRRRSDGLYMLMMGMDVQIRHFEMKLNAEHYDRKEVEAILRTLRYWRNEVQKVYACEEI